MFQANKSDAVGFVRWFAGLGNAGLVLRRETNRRGGIRRDDHLERKLASLHLPKGGNSAMNGIVAGSGPGQAGLNGRLNQDVFEAGGCGTDAADVAEEVLAAGAERRLVERIHAPGLKAFLGRPSVPSLPDRRGAVFHRKEPRRKTILKKQAISGVLSAAVGQDRKQITHAEQTRGEVCAFGVDVTREEVRSFEPEVVRKQVELQG